MTDVFSSTADFARLGYSADDAQELAKAALIYKNVGDGITDVGVATDSIISTMKAFNIEATDAIGIVDKFNEVGNNFAITSSGIGEALQRSASALSAGGNTLDESIALITGMNEVVQNPAQVGTALKTFTMYLRASKTEAEDAGIETDGMADSVSKLREELLSLTGNKVDIMADDDTYKSTYQIVKDLASVWDSLSDITQANILERIGGKRNANAVTALIKNFQTVEDVSNKATNAFGSATKENETFMQGIEGHSLTLKAQFQELSETLIKSTDITAFQKIAEIILSIATSVSKLINVLGGLKPILVGVSIKGISDFVKKINESKTAIQLLTKLLGAEGKGSIKESFVGFSLKDIKLFGGAKSIKDWWGGLGSASKFAIGASAATAVISGIVSIYNAEKQSREEALKAAQQDAEELKNTTKETTEYISKAKELRSVLDSNNRTESQAVSARRELIDIQNQLIEKFGDEARGIDLVTGSIENQIDAINDLNSNKADEYESSNKSAIDMAAVEMSGKYFNSGFGVLSLENNSSPFKAFTNGFTVRSLLPSITEDINEALKKEFGDSVQLDDRTGFIKFENIKSANQLLDAYEKVYDITSSVLKDNDVGEKDSNILLENISSSIEMLKINPMNIKMFLIHMLKIF